MRFMTNQTVSHFPVYQPDVGAPPANYGLIHVLAIRKEYLVVNLRQHFYATTIPLTFDSWNHRLQIEIGHVV